MADRPARIDSVFAFENVDIGPANCRRRDLDHDTAGTGNRDRFVDKFDQAWSYIDCRLHCVH